MRNNRRNLWAELFLSNRVTWAIIIAVLIFSVFFSYRISTSAIIVLLGGMGALVLLRQPGLGLAVLAALSFTLPLEIGTGSEVSLTAPVFLIPGITAVWLLDSFRKHSLVIPTSRSVLPLILFIISGLFSLLAGNVYWDPQVPRSGNLLLVQFGQWGIFFLSAVVFILAGELGKQETWLQLAVFVFLVIGSLVVLESFLPPSFHILGWSSAKMANRSMFWVWLAAMATGQLVFNQKLKTYVRTGLFVLLLAATYFIWFQLNDWVSGWAPFTIAVLVIIWLRIERQRRALGLLIGLFFLIFVLVFFPTLYEHAGGEQELNVSWGGRWMLYQATLDLVKEHPFLGLGPAAYRHYGHTRWLGTGYEGPLWIRPNISSHNNYIDIYAQMGLLGLGLLLWFLIEYSLTAWKLTSHFKGDFNQGYVFGVLGGLAGTLVSMLLADWFLPFVYNIGFVGFRTSAIAWMFLGGLLAIEFKASKSAE